jgi:hypothetical protein
MTASCYAPSTLTSVPLVTTLVAALKIRGREVRSERQRLFPVKLTANPQVVAAKGPRVRL